MLGFGLGDYIVLIALIQIPLTCGGGITEVREANRSNGIVNFVIAGSLFCIFAISALTPMIAIAYLQSNIFNRIVFACI